MSEYEIVKSEYNALDENNNYKTHYFKTSADQVVGLGRLKETTYSANDVVYTDTNLSVALKCTTAGTTSGSELDVSGKAVGESVTDGSVVWRVISRNIDEGLTTDGFSMSATDDNGQKNIIILTNGAENGAFLETYLGEIKSSGRGPRLVLRHRNNPTRAGQFELEAVMEDGTVIALIGKPDGALLWDGKDISKRISTINNADLNALTEYGTYYVTKGSATASQGWTSDLVASNGYLEVYQSEGTNGVKQIFRRLGTTGTNDHQVYTRQYSRNEDVWGAWRRIDTGDMKYKQGTSGYISLGDGIVFAWTNATISKSDTVVSKPIAFTTHQAFPGDRQAVNSNGATNACSWVDNKTTTTTDTFVANVTTGAAIFWIGKLV